MEQLRPNEIINSPEAPTHTLHIADLNPPNIINNPATHTREFVVGEMKEEPSKVKIDFFGGSNPNDYIKAPTEGAKPQMPGSSDASYINPLQGPGSNNPLNAAKAKEELQGSMRTLIAIIDYALSFVGQIIAKTGTQTQYTADTQQKKLLENALVDFFYDKQVKMSSGWALILAFLGAYGFMLIAAFNTRMKITKNEKAGLASPPKKDSTVKPAFVPYQRGSLTDEDVKKAQSEAPISPPPIFKPVIAAKQLETIYTENKSDGTLTSKDIPKWLHPDPKVIAKSKKELEEYISEGVYPMFMKNINNNNTRKVKYDSATGKPIYIGKPARVK